MYQFVVSLNQDNSMKLIVGLGNPGPTYSLTRHNIGFMVVDKLIGDANPADISKKSFHGKLFKSKDLLFLQPTTYMNLSGQSVQAVAHFYKIDCSDILVIHDDLDLPFGALRLKVGGGHGGHNGLRSIDASVGKNYNRLRLGIGKPERKEMVASYVLAKFGTDERELLDKFLEYSTGVARAWYDTPLEKLKSLYSQKTSGYLQ